jgi:BirA family biotin operon repressor/biotin-[acetyl-CoA-carboxylase] ligase
MAEAREQILAQLVEKNGPVSGDALAAELNISRAAVWKHVRALRQQGIHIESRLGRGYVLVSDVLSSAAIQSRLHTQYIGRPCLVLREVDSTNSEAMRLAQEGAAEGLVILAERQSRGRGRLQRRWHTLPEDTLAMSVLLRPQIPPSHAPQLSLMTAVAVHEALRDAIPELRIKWPNDILVGKSKLAGILTEIRAEPDMVQAVVIGIGVNVRAPAGGWPDDIRGIATDLSTAAGQPYARMAVAVRIMESLEDCYADYLEHGFANIRRKWWLAHAASGKRVSVHDGVNYIEGIAESLDGDGALLLKTDSGPRKVIAGDLELMEDRQ